MGPNPPSPHKILLNHTDSRPGQLSTPIDLEQVKDYLINKRSVQKHYFNKRHNTRPLPDLSPGQDVLFLSLVDQMSYLEGTIASQANMPRSYLIEAQGCRYRCNRQHIRPINTEPPSPLARPYMHTTPQTHNNPIISGPQPISGPPQPPKQPKVVWNMKMPNFTWYTHEPSNKVHKKPTTSVHIPDPTQINHLSPLIIPFQDLHHRLNYALTSCLCTLFQSMVLHSPHQQQT